MLRALLQRNYGTKLARAADENAAMAADTQAADGAKQDLASTLAEYLRRGSKDGAVTDEAVYQQLVAAAPPAAPPADANTDAAVLRQLLQKRLRAREGSLNANLVGVEDPEAERRLGCDDGRDDHWHVNMSQQQCPVLHFKQPKVRVLILAERFA